MPAVLEMASRCAIDNERGDLLKDLTTGFELLLGSVQDLRERNARLARCVKQHHSKGKLPATPCTSADDDTINIEEADITELDLENDERLERAIGAWQLLRTPSTEPVPLRRKAEAPKCPVKHDAADSKGSRFPVKHDAADSKVSRCPVKHNAGSSDAPAPFSGRQATERDFTTAGRKGDLGCPFSRLNSRENVPAASKESFEGGALAETAESSNGEDPIAAEFTHQTKVHEPSVNGSAPKCPIRFLDQHSPEEVAKYFENHKHEIPRSHEVCVKRYQANEASIRALDAKYGNLVNMIKGLGKKHQPMLHSEDGKLDNETHPADQRSDERVEEWAKDCGGSVHNGELDIRSDSGSARVPHFDRPLREVRLGESPSRPWGIQVPYSGGPASERGSESAPAPPAAGEDTKIDERAGAAVETHRSDPKKPDTFPNMQLPPLAADSKELKNGQIVFAGPVFFGYSPAEALSMLKSLQ